MGLNNATLQIKRLDEIIPGANARGLPSLKKIKQSYSQSDCARGKVAINDNPKSYSYKLFQVSDRFMETASSFENQVIVDLGAGRSPYSYILAEIFGAKAYVAVEAGNMRELLKNLGDYTKIRGEVTELDKMVDELREYISSEKKYEPELVKRVSGRMETFKERAGRTPVVLVAEDMLVALKRIPNRSVSVFASGIDKCIHPEEDYAREVEEEISRVVKTDGAYVGLFSRFQPEGLKEVSGYPDWVFKRYVRRG